MRNGFSLIELLVVVAIMGLLLGVVLAALNNARSQSQDTAIKQDLRTIHTQANIYRLNTTSFGVPVTDNSCAAAEGTLFADPVIARAILAIEVANGPGLGAFCNSSGTAYAVQAVLPGGGYWCMDSTGYAGQQAQALSPGAVSCS